MVSPKIGALTLAALLAAGCDSAAASTLTPGPSPPHGALKQSVMPRAPAARPAASCHPTTTSGHCYLPGQYCRKSDKGKSGVAGDGVKITCKKYKNGYRWERA